MKFRDFAHGVVKTLGLIVVLAFGISAVGKPQFKVLHNFSGGADGAGPVLFAALAADKSGNLFGGAEAGGYNGKDCPYGCGVVFEMIRGSGGKRMERVLFEITDPMSQGFLDSPLALDSQGDLYGCTGSYGPMFQLTPGIAQWNFNPIRPSGCLGHVGLILDVKSNLYGEFGDANSGG